MAYRHCLGFGSLVGVGRKLLEASSVISSVFHQRCQVLKHFFKEIHNLINLAKYICLIN